MKYPGTLYSMHASSIFAFIAKILPSEVKMGKILD